MIIDSKDTYYETEKEFYSLTQSLFMIHKHGLQGVYTQWEHPIDKQEFEKWFQQLPVTEN
ncbi:hypothetical protein IMZ31_22150 (plasmid) [Pontibacillus sp. ALD_SL1]|uniref:hypothetical protein n=1 Tax=Pontibacillus sp. ALD_SL1 TaxID=2777185 RepID=UPI001A956CD9|nr:hypothetical protein [Pontibacillus sp. ALD_SL1]QST02157.1 hypothetical protein IMZ31_22150 [Pontibacillus sp. ALD_SL1]